MRMMILLLLLLKSTCTTRYGKFCFQILHNLRRGRRKNFEERNHDAACVITILLHTHYEPVGSWVVLSVFSTDRAMFLCFLEP